MRYADYNELLAISKAFVSYVSLSNIYYVQLTLMFLPSFFTHSVELVFYCNITFLYGSILYSLFYRQYLY